MNSTDRPVPRIAKSTGSAYPRLSLATEASIAPEAEPDDIVEEIRAHLLEDRFRSAQRLARLAAMRFPEHAELGKLNRGLNERAVRSKPASGRDMSEEFAWLRDPPASARGQWVALIGSEMVGAARTLAELVEQLRTKRLPTSPLVHRVD